MGRKNIKPKTYYSVDAEALNYFKDKCDENYISIHDIQKITTSDIDLMFVREENAISDATKLKNLVARGKTLDFVSDVYLDSVGTGREDRLVFTKDADVHLHRYRLETPVSHNTSEGSYNWCPLYVEEGAKVTIDADEVNGGGIYVGEGEVSPDVDGPYCVTNFGGELVIKSGNFVGHGSCVYGYAGTTIIEGGFFKADVIHMDGHEDHPWTLNLLNSAYENGTAKIIVRGGTFVNFNPANPDTDDAESYLDASAKVSAETQSNGDIWYTVEYQPK